MPFPKVHSQAFDMHHANYEDRQSAYVDALVKCYQRSQAENESGQIFVYVTQAPNMHVAPGQAELHFFRTDDRRYVEALRSYSGVWDIHKIDPVEIDVADMFKMAGERVTA